MKHRLQSTTQLQPQPPPHLKATTQPQPQQPTQLKATPQPQPQQPTQLKATPQPQPQQHGQQAQVRPLFRLPTQHFVPHEHLHIVTSPWHIMQAQDATTYIVASYNHHHAASEGTDTSFKE
jgi:hypothetical protein